MNICQLGPRNAPRRSDSFQKSLWWVVWFFLLGLLIAFLYCCVVEKLQDDVFRSQIKMYYQIFNQAAFSVAESASIGLYGDRYTWGPITINSFYWFVFFIVTAMQFGILGGIIGLCTNLIIKAKSLS